MIVFLRHGKTKWNLEKKLQGKENNSMLLPVNKIFLESLNNEFNNIIFDKIYISSLKRAIDFANYLNLAYKEKIICDDIVEIAFGVFSGKRLSEIDPELLRLRNNDKWNFKPERGESYCDLYNRLNDISSELSKEQNNKNIVIVGHETCNKVLIGKIMNFKKERILSLKPPNEMIYKIDHNNLYKKEIGKDIEWEKL